MKAEKYYRKEGICILRKTDTTGVQVQTPVNPKDRLPLSLTQVTHPSKERFDEAINGWDEVDKDVFDQSMKNFCSRVEIDINRPMVEQDIQREKIRITNLNNQVAAWRSVK